VTRIEVEERHSIYGVYNVALNIIERVKEPYWIFWSTESEMKIYVRLDYNGNPYATRNYWDNDRWLWWDTAKRILQHYKEKHPEWDIPGPETIVDKSRYEKKQQEQTVYTSTSTAYLG